MVRCFGRNQFPGCVQGPGTYSPLHAISREWRRTMSLVKLFRRVTIMTMPGYKWFLLPKGSFFLKKKRVTAVKPGHTVFFFFNFLVSKRGNGHDDKRCKSKLFWPHWLRLRLTFSLEINVLPSNSAHRPRSTACHTSY